MENTCIYRTRYKYHKCNKECVENNKFCKEHLKFKNIGFFEIVNDACGNKINLLNNIDLYKILKTIFINYKSDKEELKKKLFIKIIAYLFNLEDLNLYLKKNNFKIKKNGKQEVINDIYKLLYNIYFYENNNNEIIKIQYIVRKYIKKNICIKHDISKLNHIEDPFTLDKIEEIEDNIKFYFEDNNKYYCFNAIEFEYYLRKNKLNPFTKKEINNHIEKKLNLFIKYNNLKIKNHENDIDINWDTNEQAYTDVVYYMEKIGFYNNILWFKELTYRNVIHIINLYQDLTNNINLEYKFFDENILIDITEENYVFKFAKEIIKLFKNGNDHFILCCNFIKSLSLVSDNFYNNLPEWLSTVNSDLYNRRYTTNGLLENRFAIYLNSNYDIVYPPINLQNNIIERTLGTYEDFANEDFANDDATNIIDPSTIHYILDMLNRYN